MFLYQCELAWRSIKRNPILCGLIILCLASGIATAMVSYTQYYESIFNPLSHKNNSLFMVQTDSWHQSQAFAGRALNEMPNTLSYRDVKALMRSDIPLRKTAMVHTGGTISAPGSKVKPFLANARITTRDYFAMFEETFLFGELWGREADEHFQNVVVLSEDTNQRLFQGVNSVGKVLMFEGRRYQVIAVMKDRPGHKNKIQNIDLDLSYPEDQLYLPFATLAHHEITIWAGRFDCPQDLHDYGGGYQGRLKGACSWLNYWVEFSDAGKKQQYEKFISQYISEQKQLGFYPRPLRFALSNAKQLLVINRYDSGFASLLVKLGFGVLFVCTINCVAILLAKFLKHAPESGVRRALGASRTAIFNQHLLESLFIGFLGGLLGLLFTLAALALLHRSFNVAADINGVSTSSYYESAFVPDAYIMMITILLAIVASLCAGLYPAWRICRTPAAQYLKLQ